MPEDIKLIQICQYLEGWVGLDDKGRLWRGLYKKGDLTEGIEWKMMWATYDSESRG